MANSAMRSRRWNVAAAVTTLLLLLLLLLVQLQSARHRAQTTTLMTCDMAGKVTSSERRCHLLKTTSVVVY